ncbi:MULTISPECIES: hypothetical protein [Faecalicatena]
MNVENCIITVNTYSYTIITVHKEKNMGRPGRIKNG